MKNKRGFTLIELLAVIVILAIIAVIAVPIVLNIIDETKNNATLRSAEMYLDAVEMGVAQATLKNKNIEDKTYDIMSDGNICLETLTAGKCIGTGNRENNEEDILKVEVNGETPTSGKIAITNGNISSIELNYKDGKTIVKNSDGDLVFFDFENINTGDGSSSNDQKEFVLGATFDGYYVFEDVDVSYVKEMATLTWEELKSGEEAGKYQYGGSITDTSISDHTFSSGWVKIISITIPNTVTRIGEYAFAGCDSLTNINFDGTLEEWNQIEFGENWNIDCGEIILTCTGQVITIPAHPNN